MFHFSLQSQPEVFHHELLTVNQQFRHEKAIRWYFHVLPKAIRLQITSKSNYLN